MIVKNPRREDSFEFPNLECSICHKLSSYYFLLGSYHICKTCLTDFIREIDESILKDLKECTYSTKQMMIN